MCTTNAILQISEEADTDLVGSRSKGHKGIPSLFPRLGSRAKTDIAFANTMADSEFSSVVMQRRARDDPKQRAKRLSWLEFLQCGGRVCGSRYVWRRGYRNSASKRARSSREGARW